MLFSLVCDNPVTDTEDLTPPEIISVQLNQENPVAQIVEISCIVKDNYQVKELHLWLDGEHYDNMIDSLPPYRFGLNTSVKSVTGDPYFTQNEIYNVTIKAIDVNGNYSFSDEYIDPIVLTVDNSSSYPVTPHIISVIYTNGANIITWTPNAEMDFKEYILKKRIPSNSEEWFSILNTSDRTKTSFEDVDIDPFVQVQYYLIVNDIFDYASMSEIVNSPLENAPIPVNINNITYSTEEMTIYWNQSNADDFMNYTLYHWNENFPDENYTIIAKYYNKDILSHTLNFEPSGNFTPTIHNWFKVEVSDTFNLSAISQSLTHELDSYPLPVSIDTVVYNTTDMLVTWNISSDNDVIGYKIIKNGSEQYAYINDFSVNYIFIESPDLSSPISFDIVTVDYWGQSTMSDESYEIINAAPMMPYFENIQFDPDSITFTWSEISMVDTFDFKNYRIYHSTSPDFTDSEQEFEISNFSTNSLTISTQNANSEPRYDFNKDNYFWIQTVDFWDKSSISTAAHLFEYQGYSLPIAVDLYSPYFTSNNNFKLKWSMSNNNDFSHYTVLNADNAEMNDAVVVDIYGENDLLGYTQTESQLYPYDSIDQNNYYQLVITDGYNMSDSSNVVRIWPDTFDWVNIPGGQYIYGPPISMDTLSIDDSYQILKYPVTNIQYVKYLRDYSDELIIIEVNDGITINGYFNHPEEGFFAEEKIYFNSVNSRITYDGNDYSITEGFENHPLTGISWFGGFQYAFDNQLELPTDKHWEKAARGYSNSNYPWSMHFCQDNGSIVCNISDCDTGETSFPCLDVISELNANFSNSSDPWEENFLATTPVGYYNGYNFTIDSPSYYGVYDMSGNVREWTKTLNTDGSRYILKGGAFIHSQTANELKVWGYSEIEPDRSYSNVGIRLVKDFNN